MLAPQTLHKHTSSRSSLARPVLGYTWKAWLCLDLFIFKLWRGTGANRDSNLADCLFVDFVFQSVALCMAIPKSFAINSLQNAKRAPAHRFICEQGSAGITTLAAPSLTSKSFSSLGFELSDSLVVRTNAGVTELRRSTSQ